MSYTKHAWVTGETITAEKLNNIEDGVDDLNRQLSDVEENQIPELKNAISQKADKTVATTTADGLMSASDKTKLDDVYADYSSALTALGVI